MNWSLEQVMERLIEIEEKGYIPIPPHMHRTDDGIVGQLLEREFDVEENNIALGDLGSFELKGIRKKSSLLTLTHKRPNRGASPIEIFDRFGYVRPSNRDPAITKKKLFTTVQGSRPNSLGLNLKGIGNSTVDMFFGDKLICGWDIAESLHKIDQVILVKAETTGTANSINESFHYYEGYLLDGFLPLRELVDADVVVIDFCIDQTLDEAGRPLRAPHDRGPHIRVPVSKLSRAYRRVERIL